MKWATEEELKKFDVLWLSVENHSKNLFLETQGNAVTVWLLYLGVEGKGRHLALGWEPQ